MKKLFTAKGLLLLALIITQSLSAQDNTLGIIRLQRDSRIFEGTIGNNTITMYLKLHKHHPSNDEIYSVKGWYYGEDKETKISLVGINDGSLMLYSFSTPDQENSVVEFEFKGNYFEIENYNEKLYVEDDYQKGEWTKNDTTLSVTLYDNDLCITSTKEYLLFDNEQYFDLSFFGDRVWNFSLLGHNKDNKALLSYKYRSNSNHYGQCGAGMEKGVFLIQFDDNNELDDFEKFEIESCVKNILPSKTIIVDNWVTEYFYENSEFSQEDAPYKIIVDAKRINVEYDF